MWNLPRQGMEPVSPALAGGFFPPRLPGKSTAFLLKLSLLTRSPGRGGGKGDEQMQPLLAESEGEGRVCMCACVRVHPLNIPQRSPP